MGCGCKKETVTDKKTGETKEVDVKNNIIVNIILFLISVGLSPLLYPVIIFILFKHLVIGGSIDPIYMINKFNEKKKNKETEESPEIDTLNPEDYELVGVDDITKMTTEVTNDGNTITLSYE